MVERIATPALFDHIWPRYDVKQALFRYKLTLKSPFLTKTIDLISDLAPHYKLAVVSSSGRTEVEPPIVAAGIRGCFQAMVCGREAGAAGFEVLRVTSAESVPSELRRALAEATV
jgi:phosphoglycolate phosphatase-like HAD superfamily hydrolase